MKDTHENVMHLLADILIDYFEGSEAVNYIEQTFECNHDSSKSFVMTMQRAEGLTPCQKLAKVQELNNEMHEVMQGLIENSSFQSEMPFEAEEIQLLLKRARGE